MCELDLGRCATSISHALGVNVTNISTTLYYSLLSRISYDMRLFAENKNKCVIGKSIIL